MTAENGIVPVTTTATQVCEEKECLALYRLLATTTTTTTTITTTTTQLQPS